MFVRRSQGHGCFRPSRRSRTAGWWGDYDRAGGPSPGGGAGRNLGAATAWRRRGNAPVGPSREPCGPRFAPVDFSGGSPRYPEETVRGRLEIVRSIDGGHPMHRILLTGLQSSLFLATLLGPMAWSFGQEEKSKSPGGSTPGPDPSDATLQAL